MTRVLPARADGRSGRLPACPSHLNPTAAAEWRRIAKALQRAGVLTPFDRAALAAYCQAYGRWVEAEERLREATLLYRTPSGHVQQSPLLGIVHKQLEIMGRYMVELGMTPAARSRVTALTAAPEPLTIYLQRFSTDDEEPERLVLPGERNMPVLPARRA
jgi:P27 family predicted phage terminase small subunit